MTVTGRSAGGGDGVSDAKTRPRSPSARFRQRRIGSAGSAAPDYFRISAGIRQLRDRQADRQRRTDASDGYIRTTVQASASRRAKQTVAKTYPRPFAHQPVAGRRHVGGVAGRHAIAQTDLRRLNASSYRPALSCLNTIAGAGRDRGLRAAAGVASPVTYLHDIRQAPSPDGSARRLTAAGDRECHHNVRGRLNMTIVQCRRSRRSASPAGKRPAGPRYLARECLA